MSRDPANSAVGEAVDASRPNSYISYGLHGGPLISQIAGKLCDRQTGENNVTTRFLGASLVRNAMVIGLASSLLTIATAATVEPLPIDDSQLNALSATTSGATVLPTTRTIPHWFGTTLNPNNGVTYADRREHRRQDLRRQ